MSQQATSQKVFTALQRSQGRSASLWRIAERGAERQKRGSDAEHRSQQHHLIIPPSLPRLILRIHHGQRRYVDNVNHFGAGLEDVDGFAHAHQDRADGFGATQAAE
jgi:hypothetical protein